MKPWKPKNFKPEWPSPENWCAFFLGGSLHGEIMESEQPLRSHFQHHIIAAKTDRFGDPHDVFADVENYRLEEFRIGDPHRKIWFYLHEGESTSNLLIKALTDLCIFKRESRGHR